MDGERRRLTSVILHRPRVMSSKKEAEFPALV